MLVACRECRGEEGLLMNFNCIVHSSFYNDLAIGMIMMGELLNRMGVTTACRGKLSVDRQHLEHLMNIQTCSNGTM